MYSNVVNTDIWSRSVESVHLQVVNSTFRGHVNSSCAGQPDCRTTSYHDAFGKNVSVWFKDTAFYQTLFMVRADYADKVRMLLYSESAVSMDRYSVCVKQ